MQADARDARLPDLLRIAWALGLIAGIAGAPGVTTAQDDERPPGFAGDEDEDDEDEEEYEEEGPALPDDPLRVVFQVGGGTSIRIIQHEFYAQEFAAPGYIDFFGGVVLPGPPGFRHGFGLQLSLGMTGDGSAIYGVDGVIDFVTGQQGDPPAGPQTILGPTYMLYNRLSDDLVLALKGVVVINLVPDFAPGLEVAGGLAYLFTAGVGAYGELSLSAWVGEENIIHPIASVELGLFIDYELLP